MKNGTRKKANGVRSATERPDLRAQIEMHAYEIWQANGCCIGNDLDHWLQAERDLVDPNPASDRPVAYAN